MKAQKDLEKKIEEMTSTINKAILREANPHWRKHIPVYGWTKMNYPGTVCGSLLNKYQKKNQDNYYGDSNGDIVYDRNNIFADDVEEDMSMSKNYANKSKSRSEIAEIPKIVDPVEKFMQNYKTNELKNFQEIFSNYEKTKKGLIVDNNVPHNFNSKKEQNLKKFVSETGYKFSFTWLTTDPYEKKKDYVRNE